MYLTLKEMKDKYRLPEKGLRELAHSKYAGRCTLPRRSERERIVFDEAKALECWRLVK